jgi:arylsulfatase A-like enzyme
MNVSAYKYGTIALFAIAMQASVFAVAAMDRPNFLVIVVDDMGYADLSAYEHCARDAHTPGIDRLADRGVLFTNAYVSAPVCSPSRAGWNTGQHQARWDPKSSFSCGLPKDVTHLAEIMKRNGYRTARFGKNDYGKGLHRQDVREYPLNHGFDEFLGFSAHGHDYFLLSNDIQKRTPDPQGHSAALGPLMHNRGYKEFQEDEGVADPYLTEIFTDATLDFIEQNREEPFFVTLSYNSVHHLIHQVPLRYIINYVGLQPIPNYDPDTDGNYADWFKQYITLGKISAEEMRKYYLANLECLDQNIGHLLHSLDELKLADNTVVIFFSDNGGAPTNGAWNRPLAGAKFSLWEGGIRVPFILSRPGDPHAGETWDQPISTLDVLPTCLEAAGIQLPESLDGRPIPKSSNEFKEPRHLFWRWGGTGYAVRSGDWKLLHNGTVSNRKPTAGIVNRKNLAKGTRLFNLREDISESRDLAQEHPEVVQRLKQLYADWSAEVAGGKGEAN